MYLTAVIPNYTQSIENQSKEPTPDEIPKTEQPGTRQYQGREIKSPEKRVDAQRKALAPLWR